MLTEQEVQRSWRKVFSKSEITEETLGKGDLLLEQLRPESPLRHRLSAELEELRKAHSQKQKCSS